MTRAQAATGRCVIEPEKPPHPMPLPVRAEIVHGSRRLPLDPKKLTTSGEQIRLPAAGAVLLHLE